MSTGKSDMSSYIKGGATKVSGNWKYINTKPITDSMATFVMSFVLIMVLVFTLFILPPVGA